MALFLLGAYKSHSQVLQIDTCKNSKPAEWLFYYLLNHSKKQDSAFVVRSIDSVRQWATQKGDEKMGWYADLYQIVFLSYRLYGSGTADTFLLAKEPFFARAPAEVRAAWQYHLGTFFYYQKDFERTFHYFTSANDIVESIGRQHMPLLVHFGDRLFHLHYQVGDYPAALQYVQQEIDDLRHGRSFLPLAAYFISNMGETYLKLRDLPRAKAAFREAISQARANGDSVWVGIASGNYGNTLRLQGRYAESLPYLYTEVQLNKDTIPDNSAISCVHIANSLLHLDSVEKAARYLDYALRLGPEREWSSFSDNYYQTKVLYYKKTGNLPLALRYQDSLLLRLDSSRHQNDVGLFKAMALKFKEEQRLSEWRLKEAEAAKLRFTRNSLIFLLVLLFAGVTTWLYRKRRQEKERFLEQQHQDAEELQQARERLAQYILVVKEKNRLIEEIESRLYESSDELVSDGGATTVAVQNFSGLTLLTEKDWQKFCQLFETVHPQFFTSLQSRYPGLSPAEVRLLALCKLVLSSKEMATMLGISLESLRKSRYRLRKKYPSLLEDDEFRKVI